MQADTRRTADTVLHVHRDKLHRLVEKIPAFHPYGPLGIDSEFTENSKVHISGETHRHPGDGAPARRGCLHSDAGIYPAIPVIGNPAVSAGHGHIEHVSRTGKTALPETAPILTVRRFERERNRLYTAGQPLPETEIAVHVKMGGFPHEGSIGIGIIAISVCEKRSEDS